MTDLLHDQATGVPPIAAPTPGPFPSAPDSAPPPPSPVTSTPPPPFPPPSVGDAAPPTPARSRWVLGALAALAIAGAVVMGLLWSSASSRADEADSARQSAEVERDAATQRQLETDVELATLRDELAAARDELAIVPPPPDTSELDARVAELEAEVERLTTENADLTAFIDAIDTARATEPDTAEPDVAEPPADEVPAVEQPAEVPAADTAASPEFNRFIGEMLSSRKGSSRLAQAQSECFGGAVINEIGLNALGAGLNNSATGAANNVVVGAMQNAAATCNIDAGLIFS